MDTQLIKRAKAHNSFYEDNNMSSGFKKTLIAVTVSGLMASSAAYATNGYFAHGYSTKEKGLAGAGVAHSQDAMAVATNPAGIAGMGTRMDIGAAIFNPNREYSVSGAQSAPGAIAGCTVGNEPACGTFSLSEGSVESDSDLFLIPHFAYNWHLDNDSSAALGVYGNGGMNTNYGGSASASFINPFAGPALFQDQPGTFGAGNAGVNLAQLFINASYAKKVNADHSIGVSLIFAYQQFSADGLGSFAGISENPGKLTNNGSDTSIGFGAKIGWQGKISQSVTLGASYQSEIAMDEFDDYAGLFAEGGDFDIPATLTVGLAWDVTDSSTLVVDVQQIYYEDVASIANGIEGLTSPSPATCIPGPTGGTGPTCLGGSNGSGFGWEDMTVIKLGYEWGVGDMTMRAGVSFTDGPIDDDQVLFNILAPGVVETHLTYGLTMPLGSDSEFSLALMYAPNTDVTGPNTFDPAQTIEIEMDQIEIQGSYSMMF